MLATEPSFKKSLPYEVTRDLAPVTLAVAGPYLMVTNPQTGVKNVSELIAYAKANPGKLSYGSAGLASSGHLIGELFKMTTGIDMVHVPYRGGGPSLTGLLANDVQLLFDVIASSRDLAESGKLRALAVTSPERSAVMPDTPTVMESIPGFSIVFWLGTFAPAGTPPAIMDRLYAAFADALKDAVVLEKLRALGLQTRATPPAESGEGRRRRYRALAQDHRGREDQGGVAGGRVQSVAFRPVASTTFAHLATSDTISERNCSGVCSMTLRPSLPKRSFTSSLRSATRISRASLSMIGFGVPAGARMPFQNWAS